MNNDLIQLTYKTKWSDEDDSFIGTCSEFPSLSAFGITHEEALKEIKIVVVASLDWNSKKTEVTKCGSGVIIKNRKK
jgi:hypothetical protein